MILTDKEIRELCTDKKLIEPFNEEVLQAASYDVSMSNEIQRFKKQIRTVSLKDDESLDSVYEKYIIPDDEGYYLMPGEYILATLNERINIPNDMVAHIRPRTRFTRAGLIITNQHCNPTYEGNLQIGIRNVSPNVIQIFPNLKIAQMVFERLESIPTEEKWYCNKKDAAYQNESEFRGAKFGEHEFSSPNAQALYDEVMRLIDEDRK